MWHHKGTSTCSRCATAMEESEQSEACDQSHHNLRLSCYLESFAVSAHSSTNLYSDGDSIAEPYWYEPEVAHPLYLLRSLTMMKDSTTQNW